MIIPITLAPSSTANQKLPPALAKVSHDEVVLIELQGSLHVECGDASDRNGQLVGNLQLDEMGNNPTLTIGYHLLEGKIVSLTKPLAVLYCSETSAGAPEHAQVRKGEGAASKKWCITAVVKRKIVFSKRPMPVAR
ncbi:hypothetical protein AX17_007313 [Amanita inopinata Kibby_2008]|nr:hypothetical protein AX17_007313 [Amanita inopinata Kibby_2008]